MTEWIFLAHHEEAGISCDEYINPEKTHIKQVWNDGYVDIFEIT